MRATTVAMDTSTSTNMARKFVRFRNVLRRRRCRKSRPELKRRWSRWPSVVIATRSRQPGQMEHPCHGPTLLLDAQGLAQAITKAILKARTKSRIKSRTRAKTKARIKSRTNKLLRLLRPLQHQPHPPPALRIRPPTVVDLGHILAAPIIPRLAKARMVSYS